MHFICGHDQQSVVDLAIVARELYSNRTVANFLPVSRSCTISQAFYGQDQTILYAATPIGDITLALRRVPAVQIVRSPCVSTPPKKYTGLRASIAGSRACSKAKASWIAFLSPRAAPLAS